MLDPKTPPSVAMAEGDKILSRLNRGSRNLRPDHARPNRGIGKSKDPFLIETKGELREEGRSKGINDKWNSARKSLSLKLDAPKTKAQGKQTLVKSSSVNSVPKNAFAEISSKTVNL